ncbi:MAG: ATP-binding cassette domain-containing protein [Odoribacteraceae bacterium]|jgi:ATP-binding cassette subfamily F protein 3|nr:ATP-binding cassette domain-containing protein [Odoribacteraceae bacterium]
MVSINNVSVLFGGFTLLDSVSFLINKRDRIGLTGKNGAGKSTLLKIIAGEQEPSSGTVARPSGLKVGYLPQVKAYAEGRSVREEARQAFDDIQATRAEIERLQAALASRDDYESAAYMSLIERLDHETERFHLHGGDNVEGEIEVVLKGLGFRREDLERPCEEFSGGWRMRVELAKILLARPDLFLLDEPTNHLDIESITWLESFLQGYPGAVMLVSHDRAFLDNITTRTIEISLGKVYDYRVPYTRFTELRKERVEQQRRAYENQQKQIKDTEEFIERFRYKATKAVQVQSRVKQLDKLERLEVEEEDARRLHVRFQPATRAGEVVVRCRGITKAYGDRVVLREIDAEILRGEKVAFVGRNGEGKTTLVRVIMNQVPYAGELKIGHNARVGYFAQNQADLLDPSLSVLETVDRVAVGEIRKKIRDILGAFLFPGDDVEKKVKVLSGGERSRLAMVRLLLEPYNVLILDEPTNHLDLRTKDILKEALKGFEGTVIVVSHDRDFLTGLVDKVYEFADRQVKEHLGGIARFLENKKVECFREYERMHSPPKTTGDAAPDARSFEERKRLNREIKRAEGRVQKWEEEIATLETRVTGAEERLARGDAGGAVLKDYEANKARLEQCMEAWANEHEALEKLQKGVK